MKSQLTKGISSTQAQNNFGQVLDDVTRNRVRYVINRRGVPQAIIVAFDDFSGILSDEGERRQFATVLRELQPQYDLGEVVGSR